MIYSRDIPFHSNSLEISCSCDFKHILDKASL